MQNKGNDRVFAVLTCTDRNGRHITTRRAGGLTEEIARKRLVPLLAQVIAQYPDNYYFTRMEREGHDIPRVEVRVEGKTTVTRKYH